MLCLILYCVTLMRSGWPQGEALAQALVKTEVTWTSGRNKGGNKRDRSPSPDERAHIAKRKATSSKQKYAQFQKGGKKCCIPWNMGKCAKPCPKEDMHACNVIENGKVCNSTYHRACKHWS